MTEGGEQCILCGHLTRTDAVLTVDRLLQLHQAAYGELDPPGSGLRPYRLLQCETCSLVFASPMEPGSASYYQWVASTRNYYVGKRWEWPLIRDHLVRSGPAGDVLDVGCGNGDFASMLGRESGRDVVGIDGNPKAVAECRSRGVEAHAEELAQFLSASGKGRSFAAITMSHTLEHVTDPLGLVRLASAALQPGGVVYVAVPYSPQVVEHGTYDPANLPPHHLTRWNARSLGKLAERSGMEIDLIPERAHSPIARAISEVSFRSTGWRDRSRGEKVRSSLKAPMGLAAALLHQLRRERWRGSVVGNQVLAVLTARA